MNDDPVIRPTQVLVIGGGAAGCMAAVGAKEANPEVQVTLVEKAGFVRCGSVGRGMDRLNYLVPADQVEDLVQLQIQEAEGILDVGLVRFLAEQGSECWRGWRRGGSHFLGQQRAGICNWGQIW